jgi:bacterioferritin (cytochrome b1)
VPELPAVAESAAAPTVEATAESAALTELLAALIDERDQLATEADALQARLLRAGGEPTLRRLHTAIQQRLARVAEQQARLLALTQRR